MIQKGVYVIFRGITVVLPDYLSDRERDNAFDHYSSPFTVIVINCLFLEESRYPICPMCISCFGSYRISEESLAAGMKRCPAFNRDIFPFLWIIRAGAESAEKEREQIIDQEHFV